MDNMSVSDTQKIIAFRDLIDKLAQRYPLPSYFTGPMIDPPIYDPYRYMPQGLDADEGEKIRFMRETTNPQRRI